MLKTKVHLTSAACYTIPACVQLLVHQLFDQADAPLSVSTVKQR